MNESENDSNPTSDTLAFIDLNGTPVIADGDTEEDYFICRKCNKVFKNLPDYLEHKIKDENFRITQTRSKADKRFALPNLVQKRKRQVRKRKAQVVSVRKDANGVDAAVEQNTDTDNEKKEENLDLLKQEKEKDSGPKHITGNVERAATAYSCSVCQKTFRREATLRWHIKYEHNQKEENSDESDAEESKIKEEVLSSRDEDYKAEKEIEEEDDHHLNDDAEGPGRKPREIHVVIEKPGTAEPVKQRVSKPSTGAAETERPYSCDICFRSFKELTVLKAHAVVHSDERKYICTFENCPYGFKTKGCLVRHMRRHTGERPYECERCGRAFAESGALTRHMKARRNCSEAPDSQFPRYRKSWNYHPNIPAVIDPSQRDAHRGPSTLPVPNKPELPVTDLHFILSHGAEEIVEGEDTLTGVTVKLDSSAAGAPSVEEWTVKAEPGSLAQVEVGAETKMVNSVVKPLGSLVSTGAGQDSEMLELQSIAQAEVLKPTQCQVCKKDFAAEEGLEIHLRSHLADKPSHCGLCHFLSNDREELRQHILSMHYDSLNNIEASVLSSEDPAQNKGQNSNKKVVLREALIAVKQLFSLKKNRASPTETTAPEPSTAGSVKCMVCDKSFRGSTYLRQHMRMHTGDRPYQCPHSDCHQSFISRDILKKHMFVHTEQRDFKCGECGKMFKRLAHVQQHLRVHYQDRSFRCSVCDKLFKSQNSLKVHMRTHSGINPYRCHVCGRHFRERGSLQRHQRLHTGEKPYVCPRCNRGFAEQGTLSRHLKAKIPCSADREQSSGTQGMEEGTVLAQFSTVVADTQHYILPQLDDDQSLILPSAPGAEQEELTGEYVVENIEVITEEADSSVRHSTEEAILATTVDGQRVEGAVVDGQMVSTGQVVDGQMVSTEQMVDGQIVTTGQVVDGQMVGAEAVEGQMVDSAVVEALANEGDEQTETLQIFDASTGESVIIVAERSIVDLVREQQLTFDSVQGESSLQRIKDLIIAAGEGRVTASTQSELDVAVQEPLWQDQQIDIGTADTVIVSGIGAETTETSQLGTEQVTVLDTVSDLGPELMAERGSGD
ncbi:transcription factor E4F1 isoform X2 [Aplysia californica]|uniref:Transcription factor E4F1 isoform X2 n=1 Tax=Aplysia californica TaxID=6500 RepID=A0ABM0JLI5_APLCA|nr:transcription factor E4F1 isoform X2 [Aplysia californica]